MKVATVFISYLLIMSACRPAKQIQKTSEVISNLKTDTTPVAAAGKTTAADSNAIIKDVFNKILQKKISFTTFSAKVKTAYHSNEENEDATAYIRIKNDSAIWLSLRGPFGIEGFRILITKDSVKVIDFLKKNVQLKSIYFMRDFTGIPFDFIALQDLIIGNPVFTGSNLQSCMADDQKHLQLQINGTFFKHLMTVDNTDYRILHSTLTDVNTATQRTFEVSYNDYDNDTAVTFSTKRIISLEAKQSKSDTNLDFKQYNFNQPVTFPFTIPDNYKRL